MVSVVQSLANEVAELAHQGWVERAGADEQVCAQSGPMTTLRLATFQDLTEKLWLDER